MSAGARPVHTAEPEDYVNPLSQSDLQRLASVANAIEPARAEALMRKDGPVDVPGIGALPNDSLVELSRFWSAHPDLREECTAKYGHDPVTAPDRYWPPGLAEPEHHAILVAARKAGSFTLPLVKRWQRQELAHARLEKADAVVAAGIAVRAADTGRVLMIQRSTEQGSDPNAGTWEFPGGRLTDGEHPYTGARREWQEEMGTRLPKGAHVGGWRSGVYQGFVHEVPIEASVKLNLDGEDRRVRNPDDPDGDNAEVAAWWDPEHLRYMRALRPELRDSQVWTKVEKAQARPATLKLRVHGVSAAPGGLRVYRMETRDGRYVGRTNATRFRARKGDVLKVQAQDFLQDVQGDPRWTNVGVIGYTDSSHSWRELEALAGGRLEGEPPDEVDKDGAPGDAGNLPAAGDPGVVSTIGGDGPTLAAVHVDIPLGGVSQAYVNRQTRRRFKAGSESVLRGEFLPVAKGQEWKQLVYGVVLEPNSIDSQDDFMLPHHVEKTAHNYLKKAIRGRSTVAKLQHGAHPGGFSKAKASIVPVESFIAPVDFSYDGKEQIKKGSWVLAMHVEDPELWQDFLSGKYRAFSVGGSGVRRAVRGAADLVPHGLIGVQQPDYFNPDPRKMALVAGG